MDSNGPFARIASLLAAWALLLLITGLIDSVAGTFLQLPTSAWELCGFLVIRHRRVRPPTQRLEGLDVVSGLRMLWWAAAWPIFLLRR